MYPMPRIIRLLSRKEVDVVMGNAVEMVDNTLQREHPACMIRVDNDIYKDVASQAGASIRKHHPNPNQYQQAGHYCYWISRLKPLSTDSPTLNGGPYEHKLNALGGLFFGATLLCQAYPPHVRPAPYLGPDRIFELFVAVQNGELTPEALSARFLEMERSW